MNTLTKMPKALYGNAFSFLCNSSSNVEPILTPFRHNIHNKLIEHNRSHTLEFQFTLPDNR